MIDILMGYVKRWAVIFIKNFFGAIRRTIIDDNDFLFEVQGFDPAKQFADGYLLVIDWNDD